MVIHAYARIQVGKMAVAAGGRRHRRETSKRNAAAHIFHCRLTKRRVPHRPKGYSGNPEIGYPLDDIVTLLEVGLAQLVILLLDFEDLIAGLLVQAIDLILASVDLLEGFLDLDVVVTHVSLAGAWILQFLGLLARRRHGR